MDQVQTTIEILPLATLVDTKDATISNIITTERVKFPWKLEKKDWTTTIFSKIKMREVTDITLIYGFIKADMGISFADLKRYDGLPSEIKTELDMVRSYKNLYNKKQKHFAVAHILPKHKWGRTIPAKYLSMSVFHRPTRHRLCEGWYKDLDISNAHPQFICDIANQHNMDLKSLKKYVLNPKEYRKKICEHHGLNFEIDKHRDIAKNLPILLMYGGCYDSWIKNNNIETNENKKIPLFAMIEAEMSCVMETVYNENQHIVKDILKHEPKKWSNEGEKKRGVMALWAQTIERGIMEDAMKYLVDTKGFILEDIVPCQDGLMILKDLYYDNICIELTSLSRTKYNFNLTWVDKPFDEAIEIPTFGDILTAQEWIDELSTKKLANRLKEMKENYILFGDSGLFVYCNNRWYNETEYPKKAFHFRKYISEDLYEDRFAAISTAVELSVDEQDKLKEKLRNVTSNGTCIKDIIDHYLCNAKKIPEEGFDAKPFLLGFENGVIDLRGKEFREYNFDDYLTLSTGYNYFAPNYNDPEIGKLKTELDKIFQEIQENTEHLKLLKQVLASGLDGINYQSMWFLNGTGGNGKGFIGRLMRKILGSFCYCPNGGILKDVTRANAASPDIADLQYKRYVLFTEMGGTINLTALRRLTGGDGFTGRQLHRGNVSFNLVATLCGEFNIIPEFDQKPEVADYRRCRDIKFGNNWTEDTNLIGKAVDGITYRAANPYYQTPEYVEKVYLLYLDMLLDCYKCSFRESCIKFDIPADIWRASRSLLDDTNKFKRFFENCYERDPTKDGDQMETDEHNNKIYPNRIKLGDIWSDIQFNEEYKDGKRKNPREYERNWGVKNYFKWCEITFDVKTDKYKYILGYKRSDEDL